MDAAIAAALAALLAGAPNLVIAIWMLSRQDQRIDQLLENEKWLIEQLMAMHPPQDAETGAEGVKTDGMVQSDLKRRKTP